MLNDVNSNDKLPISVDDAPSLTHQPNSAKGDHGKIGNVINFCLSSLESCLLALICVFTCKGEWQVQCNKVLLAQFNRTKNLSSVMKIFLHYQELKKHQQNIPSVTGGSDSSTSANHPGQIPDGFPSSNSMQDIQLNDRPDNGMMRSTNNFAAMSLHDRPMRKSQQQIPSSSHLQHLPANDPYGLLGLHHALERRNPDLDFDLMSLLPGLSSSEDFHKRFNSWSVKPVNVYPDSVSPLNENVCKDFSLEILFYTYYSIPRVEAQLDAANELSKRGWFHHKELQKWFLKSPDMKPLVKTSTYQIGSFLVFDPDRWETKTVNNFCVPYNLIEQAPVPYKQVLNIVF